MACDTHFLLNHSPSDSLSAYNLYRYSFRIAVKMSGITAIPQSSKEPMQNSKAKDVVGIVASPQQYGVRRALTPQGKTDCDITL